MTDLRSDSEVVIELAEEFIDRYRRGDRPPLAEYTSKFPHLKDRIEDVFPAMAMMENIAIRDPSEASDDKASRDRHKLHPPSIGDFRIIREAGRGGMGVVYEAEQVSLGRHVALKVLPSSVLPDSKHVQRFEREAKSAAKLHHTNIVPVFGVGEQDGVHYYVMQFIQGLPLNEVIAELKTVQAQPTGAAFSRAVPENSEPSTPEFSAADMARSLMTGQFPDVEQLENRAPDEPHDHDLHDATVLGSEIAEPFPPADSLNLSGSFSSSVSLPGKSGIQTVSQPRKKITYWESVANIGHEVAEAMHYAHEQGILHRDIKPSNLLLDLKGTTWITDFGLAKATDQQDITHTGDILGTLRYMPPEAFEGRADARSDVYSLGLTLYELLAFKPAFGVKERHQLIKQVTTEAAPRLDRLNSAIPRDLVTIVHKAIDRDPNHRYQTAEEMSLDLQRFIHDEPIKARRISAIERLQRWSRRNRALTIALGTIATLLVFGSIAATLFAFEFREQRDFAEVQREIAEEQREIAEEQREIAEDAKRAAEYSNYVSNIQLANHYLSNKSTTLAQRILREIPAEYRGWEWSAAAGDAWRQFASQQHTGIAPETNIPANEFWKQGQPIKYQEFSDTNYKISVGQFDASGTRVLLSLQRGFTFFSVADAQRLATFQHPDRRSQLLFGKISPDGTKLVTAPMSRHPLIFSLDDPESPPVQLPTPNGKLSSTMDWVWSPDEKYVVSSHFDKRIRIWNVETHELHQVLPPNETEVRNLSFDDTGEILWAVATNGQIVRWHFPEGELIDRISCPDPNPLRFQVLSPDNKQVLAMLQDGKCFLWDIETRETLPLKGQEVDTSTSNANRRLAAVFSPEGTCVAIMRGLVDIDIYDTQTQERICSIEGHPSPVQSIEFSPDGTKVMTTGEFGTAIVWSAEPKQPDSETLVTQAHDEPVYQIDIDESGTRLLAGSFDATVSVSDLKTKAVLTTYREHEDDVIAVDFHKDGVRAASFDRSGALHVWDTGTGEKLYDIDPHSIAFKRVLGTAGGGDRGEIFSFPATFSTGLFSPDGKRIVIFQDGRMTAFDAETGTALFPLEGSQEPGWAVFSPDSKLVAIIEMDETRPGVWDLETGELRYRLVGHKQSLAMISFSPDNQYIATGGMDGSGSCILWDRNTGELIRRMEGPYSYTSSCRFSSSGDLLLIGTAEHKCQIRDVRTGELLSTIHGHVGRIRDVRFSPDETRLVSWSVDDQVIVWDTARPYANPLLTINGEGRPLQARWTPDSRQLLTTWTDGRIEFLQGATREELTNLPDFRGNEEEFEHEFLRWRNKYLWYARSEGN